MSCWSYTLPCFDRCGAAGHAQRDPDYSLAGKGISSKAHAAHSSLLGLALMGGYLAADGFTSSWQDRMFRRHRGTCGMSIYNQILYVQACSAAVSVISLIVFGQVRGWCVLPAACCLLYSSGCQISLTPTPTLKDCAGNRIRGPPPRLPAQHRDAFRGRDGCTAVHFAHDQGPSVRRLTPVPLPLRDPTPSRSLARCSLQPS